MLERVRIRYLRSAWLSAAAAAVALVSLELPLRAQGNAIQSIKTIGSSIEVTVKSANQFDVRDEAVVLQIGSQLFSTSRSPDDGDTSVLIFVMTPAQFDQTSTGDPVSVGWGSDGSSDRRDFGTLDKSILDK